MQHCSSLEDASKQDDSVDELASNISEDNDGPEDNHMESEVEDSGLASADEASVVQAEGPKNGRHTQCSESKQHLMLFWV